MSPALGFPTVLQSSCIFCVKKVITSCKVTLYWSGGSIQFFLGVSEDPVTTPTVWEEVTSLVSGTEKAFTFTVSGKALFYRIVKEEDVIISTQVDSINRMTAPALRIRDFTVTA